MVSLAEWLEGVSPSGHPAIGVTETNGDCCEPPELGEIGRPGGHDTEQPRGAAPVDGVGISVCAGGLAATSAKP